jgi:hypothetical protein
MRLVNALQGRQLEGPSRGGPYHGLKQDDVTKPIVQAGPPIVPLLSAKLKDCSYSEAAYIVFCLREIGDHSLKDQVTELKRDVMAGRRFGEEPHDLTLIMEIDHYLKMVSTTNDPKD